jgi:hypothetical protein
MDKKAIKTVDQIISDCVDSTQRTTLKYSIWKIARILNVEEATKLLREIADDIDAEVTTFGESK